MRIIDLTDQYVRHYIKEKNQQAYENSYPNLFEHYYKFTKNDRSILSLTIDEVKSKLKIVEDELGYIENRINDYGFKIDELKIVLFVGIGTTNGHAFRENNEFIVWIPIETYTTSMLARVFITHEIIHALHYAKQPEFYFDNLDEMKITSRQLVTEGLATLLTGEVLGVDDITALWADYLDNDTAEKWYQKCQAHEREICQLLKESYIRNDPDIKLFYAMNPDDILAFRAGYYIGMKILHEIIKENRITVRELLDMSKTKLEKLVFQRL